MWRRDELQADMAEKSSTAKNFLFRAEDARLLDDMGEMMTSYRELSALNQDLLRTYQIRCTNHEELLRCLKIVNKHIQQAAKLRVGTPKTAIIAGCRQAIKSNDVDALFRLIKFGAPSDE
jgi:Bardet-Biedl syndrome 2 protein